MALDTASICAGIAALSVAGVTIKDLDEVPVTVKTGDCPIMFPEPQELTSTDSGEPLTFGSITAYWAPQRTLLYTYLHTAATMGRPIKDHYPGMAAKQDLLFEAVAEMSIAGVDVVGISFSRMGTLQNVGTKAQFYGFTMSVTVKEKVNA